MAELQRTCTPQRRGGQHKYAIERIDRFRRIKPVTGRGKTKGRTRRSFGLTKKRKDYRKIVIIVKDVHSYVKRRYDTREILYDRRPVVDVRSSAKGLYGLYCSTHARLWL